MKPVIYSRDIGPVQVFRAGIGQRASVDVMTTDPIAHHRVDVSHTVHDDRTTPTLPRDQAARLLTAELDLLVEQALVDEFARHGAERVPSWLEIVELNVRNIRNELFGSGQYADRAD